MASRKGNKKYSKSKNKRAVKLPKGIIAALVLVCAFFVVYNFFPEYIDFIFGEGDLPSGEYVGEGTAEFHFIDVGQGDGILVRTDKGDIVIDAGPSSTEDDFVDYLKSCGVTSIEYLVLTHPHSDHIGGADAVLEEFDVKRVILPKTDCTTSMYLKVLKLIDAEKCEVIEAKINETYSLGDFKMTVLAPNGINYDGYNNSSVVLRAELGNTSVLLTGDAEKISEGEMLENISPSLLRCDLLKVGHHGSSTSTVKEFYDAVSPTYAVISCGENNEYGHPHSETIATLKALEDKGHLYRTDVSGTVIFVTDGNTLEKKAG